MKKFVFFGQKVGAKWNVGQLWQPRFEVSLEFVHNELTALCIHPLVAISDVIVALTEVADVGRCSSSFS
jgi:hypothetical protein